MRLVQSVNFEDLIRVVGVALFQLVIRNAVRGIKRQFLNVSRDQFVFKERKTALLAHPGKRIDGFEVIFLGQAGTLPTELE